jgi:urease accessory protein
MKRLSILGLILLFSSGSAFAHPAHGLESVYAGFLHPLTGWDHLLVMIAVGVWATWFGEPIRWQMPLTFLLFMLAGMGLSAFGFNGQLLELAISSSVMIMGLLLALAVKLPNNITIMILMIFASFHGMAHGAELSSQKAWLAMFGMLLATGCLHLIGISLGMQKKPIMKKFNLGFAWVMFTIGAYWTLA